MRLVALLPPIFISLSVALAVPTISPLDEVRVVASAWLPGWIDKYNLDWIPWKWYTHLTFAFAVTTDDESMISLNMVNETFLQQFVARAKTERVISAVSIGGWTGSQYFSKHVQPDCQDAFVEKIASLVRKYNLDGIDFDWEYPNKVGVGCNSRSPDDSKNFLSFLKKLRTHLGSKLELTAAVAITPFSGEDGSPMQNVSEFATVLDRIAIMNYDIWGPWSLAVGPNAPLNDTCAPQQMGSAESAVKAWTDAGFPTKKIVLGVPAYGHSYYVGRDVAIDEDGELVLYPQFKSTIPPGEGESADTGKDQCGNPSGPSGVWNFEGLISEGFLRNSFGKITPARGMKHRFDECSQTPFVYNPKTQVMVSYDDARSFTAKGNFINDNGLLGFAMWDASGDSRQSTLVKAISTVIFNH